MAKKGYSLKGFFGETIHYDANGKKIGESRKNFWGGYDHFDVNGKKTGSSRETFFGGVNHFDNNGNKTGYIRSDLMEKIGEVAPPVTISPTVPVEDVQPVSAKIVGNTVRVRSDASTQGGIITNVLKDTVVTALIRGK